MHRKISYAALRTPFFPFVYFQGNGRLRARWAASAAPTAA